MEQAVFAAVGYSCPPWEDMILFSMDESGGPAWGAAHLFCVKMGRAAFLWGAKIRRTPPSCIFPAARQGACGNGGCHTASCAI